jgi:hypothetical protein
MSREQRIYKLGQALVESDNESLGRDLAQIIKFIMRRISFEKRPFAIMKLRSKIWGLDETQISSKNSPDTAAIGQAITFVKTILNGKDASYIRKVLSDIIRELS